MPHPVGMHCRSCIALKLLQLSLSVAGAGLCKALHPTQYTLFEVTTEDQSSPYKLLRVQRCLELICLLHMT